MWVFDFSDKMMEGDEGLRTVECLRGRLLAERAASKVANDESEQIGKKVCFFRYHCMFESVFSHSNVYVCVCFNSGFEFGFLYVHCLI